jgi:hypothetical protein
MEKEIEIWKDIPNQEGIYKASNMGRIKSFAYDEDFEELKKATISYLKKKKAKLQI